MKTIKDKQKIKISRWQIYQLVRALKVPSHKISINYKGGSQQYLVG